MITNIITTAVVLFTANAFAEMPNKISCVLQPRLFVGNVQFELNIADETYEITYDDPQNSNNKIVSVSGPLYVSGQDGMGFDIFPLCTDKVCSGKTYLGALKAADQADSNDRESYFEVNPNSATPIKVKRGNTEFTLTGINKLECSYESIKLF